MCTLVHLLLLSYVSVFRPLRGMLKSGIVLGAPSWGSVSEAVLLCMLSIWGASQITSDVEVLGLGCSAGHILIATGISIIVISGVDISLLVLFTKLSQRTTAYQPSGGLLAAEKTVILAKPRLRFVLLCVFAGFWEELLFRAIPFAIAQQAQLSTLLLGILSTFVFAINHSRLGTQGILYSAFFGAIFFTLFCFHHSLVANVAAHVIGNIVAGFIVAPRLIRSRNSVVFPI